MLYPNMTFAVASDTRSVWPLWMHLVPAWSLVALHSARDQRTERKRSLTPGLRPHLNLNGVGIIGLLGGADSGGWEDIIV